ncbi:MAG: sensor histidine kinase [Solirubrobacteraceae bacterium]
MATRRNRLSWSPDRRERRERPLTIALGWRLPAWLLTFGPVAFIVMIGLASLGYSGHTATPRALLGLGLLASAGALLLRHRAPLTVLAVVLALAVTLGWGPIVALPVLLAVFTVAEYVDRRRLVAASVVAAGTLVVADAVHRVGLSVPAVLSHLVAVGLALAVGLYLRARADYITGLRERAERLERERELLAQQAVAEERVRIARELHDVVAHNVSLMVVQAQAAAATGTEPQRETLRQVADLGRGALSEMHRMLGLLRIQNGGAPEREPQPGVGEIPTLVERTRAAGLQTQLTVAGAPHPLPAGVDLSAYRIVQEALTNAIRHGAATHASVTLAYSPAALEVTVLDDGSGVGNGGIGPGHGLIGMRERVALFGGDLETGRRGDGHGYRVRALIPLN